MVGSAVGYLIQGNCLVGLDQFDLAIDSFNEGLQSVSLGIDLLRIELGSK